MLILLCVIFAIVGIGAFIAAEKSYDFEEVLQGVGAVCLFLLVICIIAAIIVGVNYKESETVDARIELYETENQKIELAMATVASEYKEFEKETYEAMLENPEIVLVIPELKSDTIVQEQIKIYKENKAKIVALKEEKLNRDILRWWLFF